MARIDKYEPKSGGFRAPLGFAPAAGDVGDVIAVTLDGNGRIQKTGADGTLCRGVICLSSQLAQGDACDVMTDGEIVDVTTSEVTGAAAGVVVSAGGTGAVSNAGGGVVVGWFVQAWRLVVRLGRA